MRLKVRKKEANRVRAFRLGEEGNMVKSLMEQGRIRKRGTGYEVLSREALNGNQPGEKAEADDYIKLDEGGYPYPNKKDYFLKNHRLLEADNYEQLPQTLIAWKADMDDDTLCEEMRFLMKEKGLVIHPDNPGEFLSAPLWGTILTADRDAVVIFYRIDRDNSDNITDVDFNFCAWEEFQKTYDIVERVPEGDPV